MHYIIRFTKVLLILLKSMLLFKCKDILFTLLITMCFFIMPIPYKTKRKDLLRRNLHLISLCLSSAGCRLIQDGGETSMGTDRIKLCATLLPTF